MTEQQAVRFARSARNVGILVTLWGAVMLSIALLIADVGSISSRLIHDVALTLSSVTLLIVGIGTITSMELALRGTSRAHVAITLVTLILLVYGIAAFGAFIAATAFQRSHGIAFLMAIPAGAMLAAWFAVIWRVRRAASTVVDALRGLT